MAAIQQSNEVRLLDSIMEYPLPSINGKLYVFHSHWADVVVAEDPDVITLQEVRLDTTFTASDSKITHWMHDNNGMADFV